MTMGMRFHGVMTSAAAPAAAAFSCTASAMLMDAARAASIFVSLLILAGLLVLTGLLSITLISSLIALLVLVILLVLSILAIVPAPASETRG